MLKIIYISLIVLSVVFLIVVYFTNIMWLGNQTMFLWSKESSVSVSFWLFLIIIAAFIFWFSVFWLITTLINKRPKDFDEFDI